MVVTYENVCERTRFAIDSTKPCIKQEVNPEVYIVPGLFAMARIATNYNATLSFDNDFGYPVNISYNASQNTHEQKIWTVESFQILN